MMKFPSFIKHLKPSLKIATNNCYSDLNITYSEEKNAIEEERHTISMLIIVNVYLTKKKEHITIDMLLFLCNCFSEDNL